MRRASDTYSRPAQGATAFFVGLAVIAALSLAQDVLLPLAIAALLSFVLAPVSGWLERHRFNRGLSSVFTVALAFAVLSGLTWVVGNQFLGLAKDLPQYKETLKERIRPLRGPLGKGIDETTRTVQELADEIKTPQGAREAQQRIPKVQVVDPPMNVMERLHSLFGPILRPLALVGLALVFLLFMLLERDMLRDRMIRLAGGNLHRTTQALSEAARRVSRYLAMQTMINGMLGTLFAAGLFLLDVPNAVLWGALLAVLRFIPYLGAWTAAICPVVLSFAVFDDWTHPLLTVGLFVGLEIACNQFLEPVLYGRHTGVSPLALIVGAAFWTWLWGVAGLLVAIPLTVTLVVLGKYIPQLAFLGVLMGDQPVLQPSERFYQRLLARVPGDAEEVLEETAKSCTPREALDAILIPALAMAEHDHYRGALGNGHHLYVLAHIDGMIEDLFQASQHSAPVAGASADVLCLAAYDEADEIAANAFARVLQSAGVAARSVPPVASPSELRALVEKAAPKCIYVCAFPTPGIARVRQMCRRMHAALPGVKLCAALWGVGEVREAVSQAFHNDGVEMVVSDFASGAQALTGNGRAHKTPPPARALPEPA